MATITISRQYGSGGQEIAARLCEMLGYKYFDKRLMAQVAADVAVSDQEIVDFSEDDYKIRGFSERLFGSQWKVPHPTNQMAGLKAHVAEARVTEVKKLDEEYNITLVQSTIYAAHQHGNVVIVGRGGQVLLKDEPDVLHVRIEAPLYFRAWRLQSKNNITIAEGLHLADSRDRAAEAYLRRFHQIDWADPMLYHLIINTGKWKTEEATQIIANAVKLL